MYPLNRLFPNDHLNLINFPDAAEMTRVSVLLTYSILNNVMTCMVHTSELGLLDHIVMH